MSQCQYELHCLQKDRILYRICNNTQSPQYQRIVDSAKCTSCSLKANDIQGTHPIATVTKSVEQVPTTPNLRTRILTYTEAVAKWITAGRPERSDEEVQRIFQEHCEPCSWRKRRSNICRGCGCRVAAYGMAVLNKIKMATEHCPREKW